MEALTLVTERLSAGRSPSSGSSGVFQAHNISGQQSPGTSQALCYFCREFENNREKLITILSLIIQKLEIIYIQAEVPLY